MEKQKKRINFYLDPSLVERVKEKREKNKTFTSFNALITALLEKYAKDEITFK